MKNALILFGGVSSEHDVSVVSAVLASSAVCSGCFVSVVVSFAAQAIIVKTMRAARSRAVSFFMLFPPFFDFVVLEKLGVNIANVVQRHGLRVLVEQAMNLAGGNRQKFEVFGLNAERLEVIGDIEVAA